MKAEKLRSPVIDGKRIELEKIYTPHDQLRERNTIDYLRNDAMRQTRTPVPTIDGSNSM